MSHAPLNWIKPGDITTSTSAASFLAKLSDEQKSDFTGDPNDICKTISELPVVVNHGMQPFILILAKPQPSKKGTRVELLIDSHRSLNLYSPDTGDLKNLGAIDKAACKPKRYIEFDLHSGKHLKFTTKQPFRQLDSVIVDFLSKDVSLPPLMTTILSLSEFGSDPTCFGPLNYAAVSFCRSPDLLFMRHLEILPIPSRIIRELAYPLMVIFAQTNQMPYMLRSLVPLYFSQVQSQTQIFRGETMVIGVMNSIRNKYAYEQTHALYHQVIKILEKTDDTEEILDGMLGVIDSVEWPAQIRLVCHILSQYATLIYGKPMPQYIAISGYLLLRGVGPLLNSKDPQIKQKFQLFNQLINFSDSPQFAPYTERLKTILNKFSGGDVPVVPSWGFAPKDLDEEVHELLRVLVKHSNDIIAVVDEHLNNTSFDTHDSPVLQFVKEVQQVMASQQSQ